MPKLLRKIGRYLLNWLIWIDQGLNTALGGDPDETLSSRLGKHRARCRLCDWLCRVLDRIDPGHCADAIEADEGEHEVIR